MSINECVTVRVCDCLWVGDCVCVWLRMPVWLCMCVTVCVWLCMRMWLCMYMRLCVWLYAWLCMCCMTVCMWLWMCVCDIPCVTVYVCVELCVCKSGKRHCLECITDRNDWQIHTSLSSERQPVCSHLVGGPIHSHWSLALYTNTTHYYPYLTRLRCDEHLRQRTIVSDASAIYWKDYLTVWNAKPWGLFIKLWSYALDDPAAD